MPHSLPLSLHCCKLPTTFSIGEERRLGELIKAQKETVGLNRGAAGLGSNQHVVRSPSGTAPPTLAEAGIDKKLSSRPTGTKSEPVVRPTLAEAGTEATALLSCYANPAYIRSSEPRPDLNACASQIAPGREVQVGGLGGKLPRQPRHHQVADND